MLRALLDIKVLYPDNDSNTVSMIIMTLWLEHTEVVNKKFSNKFVYFILDLTPEDEMVLRSHVEDESSDSTDSTELEKKVNAFVMSRVTR